MKQFYDVILIGGVAAALCIGGIQTQVQAQKAPEHMVAVQLPAQPAPVPVTLNAKTTALLVLDYVNPICTRQPICMTTMLPVATKFIAQARKAGVTMVFGTRAHTMDKWLPDVGPGSGDIKVVNTAQDRFYGTDLETQLKEKGIKTVIVCGWRINGSVAYTSVGATARDYTVVIPVDMTSAPTDYERKFGFFQVLSQNPRNLDNEPLKPKAVTLSRSDMITLK